MFFIPLWCRLTLPELIKTETETHPSWFSMFLSHLCQLPGNISQIYRTSRQASRDEYAGMPSPVRKSSKFKDLKCHHIPTIATLPSGHPTSEYSHTLRETIPYLGSWDF
jgi:hypothetical protein